MNANVLLIHMCLSNILRHLYYLWCLRLFDFFLNGQKLFWFSLDISQDWCRQCFICFGCFFKQLCLLQAVLFKLLKLLGEAVIWTNDSSLLSAEIQSIEEPHTLFADQVSDHTR